VEVETIATSPEVEVEVEVVSGGQAGWRQGRSKLRYGDIKE